MKVELFKLVDISNEEYHKQRGEDEHYYSSSQLKDMEDPEVFYKKYITKEIARKEIPAFDIGTYFHTAILEPDKLDEECAVYMGAQRKGKVWKAFKEEHAGKAIITKSEHAKAMNLINGFKASALSEGIYSGGKAELSLFVEYWVHFETQAIYLLVNGNIYTLDETGWMQVDSAPAPLVKIRIKVRGDYIQETAGHLADLKSTTGNPKDAKSIKDKVRNYWYDMSASLYVDAFNAYALYTYGEEKFKDFYWSFATKDNPICQHYRCTSTMFSLGRAKYKKAIIDLAKFSSKGWEFEEEIISLDPAPFEVAEWSEQPKQEEQKTFVKPQPKPVSNGEDLL